jgi:predicted flap endonuclease-1-like 5' DNA nuclease
MTYLLLQTFVLLLASYFLGAFLACLVKRTAMGERAAEPVPARLEAQVPPPVTIPVPQPVRARGAPRAIQPVKPRPIDPVQPKIDVLRRPEPRPAPKLIDPTRFERALMGPDPNEGIARKAIVEIRPAVLKSPTGPVRPRPAAVAPPATPPIKTEHVTARAMDATTASAAGAVAAAKAAAAASVTAPAGANERSASDAKRPAVPPQLVSPPSPPAAPKTVAKPIEPEPEKPKAAEKAPPIVKVPIEGGDDLQRIRAIDADLEHRLKGDGVIYFEHIAAWTPGDVKRIGQALGIPGRIDREQWVEQAQILAKGGETYYSRNRVAAQRADAATAPSSSREASAPVTVAAPVPQASQATQSVGPASSGSTPIASSALAAAVPAQPSGVAALIQNRSVAEMAAAAAAAIAAASASVTRGLKPIEPISPLSKVDPRISIPAKLSDAIREKGAATAATQVAVDKEEAKIEGTSHGRSDDLKRIRGIGVLIEKRLNALGIARYEQIANWTSGDIDRVSQTLEFKGRIERESWVEQARILSSGGQTEFSRRVDRGEVDTSRET